MRRATVDKLVSWTGLVVAGVLLVAGGLLTWAHFYIHDQVQEQLSAQHITMPEGDALTTQDMKDALSQYGGQKMTTGAQAKAYADHYILVHMNEAADGQTYSEVSGQFMQMSQDPNADPDQVEQLGQLRQTLFMGTTLRGMLLNAYAFDTIATLSLYAAIGAFLGAALLIILGVFGLRHAKEAQEEAAQAELV